MTDQSASAMIIALEQGVDTAEALKPGDVFLGAFGAADAAGYPVGHAYRDLFLSGHMMGLHNKYPFGVRVTIEGNRII